MAWRGEEVRVQTKFGEESGEITFRRAVLEPVCLRGMTSGPQSWVTERERGVTVRLGVLAGPWAPSRARPKWFPASLLPFLIFISPFFLFSFDFWFENFCKTSDLFQASFFEICKVSYLLLDIQRRFWF
jgi:hypothetical protein